MATGYITPEVIVDGTWPIVSTNLTTGLTLPFIGGPPAQANLIDGAIADASPAVVGGSPAGPTRASTYAYTFERDWYDRVHVVPRTIDMGHVLQPQVRTFDVWNAHFVPRTLNSITISGADGLVLTRPAGAPSEPASYGALLLLTYTVTVGASGPPVIDASYVFNFNTPETPFVEITGSRAIAFPFSAQSAVLEELEWATDIHESYDGHEKRVQARELPRQYFEMEYLSGSRTEVANIRNSLIGNLGLVFGVPAWQESRPLLANVAVGATTITVTTTNADFRAGTGELAILWVSSTDYELVEVASVAAGSLTLARPTIGDFTAGITTVAPVRLCHAQDNPSDDTYRNGPASFTIRWKCNDVVDLSEIDGNLTLYLGSPVIQDANYIDGKIGEVFAAKFHEIDSESGILDQIERRDAPEVSSTKTWIFEDAAASFGLRKLLYALRGRQRSFWLPTFRHDFVLAASIGPAVTSFEVLPVEYGRFVSEQPPFNHVAIFLNNGTVFHRQITGHGTSGSNETISINSALGQTVNPSDVRYICYLVRSRLATDRVQIEHRRLGAVTVRVPVVGVIQ